MKNAGIFFALSLDFDTIFIYLFIPASNFLNHKPIPEELSGLEHKHIYSNGIVTAKFEVKLKTLNTMHETLTKTESTLVEKETISNLSFKKEVFFNQHPDLQKKLEDATKLGNTSKVKFYIDFYADSGLKTVQTTVWATGKKFICLKGGLWIPISKIVDIRFV